MHVYRDTRNMLGWDRIATWTSDDESCTVSLIHKKVQSINYVFLIYIQQCANHSTRVFRKVLLVSPVFIVFTNTNTYKHSQLYGNKNGGLCIFFVISNHTFCTLSHHFARQENKTLFRFTFQYVRFVFVQCLVSTFLIRVCLYVLPGLRS